MYDSSTARRSDIDALRVFASYLLFLFHTAMIFNPAPFFHVRNDEVSVVFLVLAGFISLWHMPLFFVLAGWSLLASLRRRSVASFTAERILRLGVPLVAGCVLLAPAMKYLELRSGLDLSHTGLRVAPALQASFAEVVPSGLIPQAPPFTEGFLEFVPTFFTDLDRFSWGHLWFLAYLLTFSLMYLPAFAALAKRRPRQLRYPRLVLYVPVLALVLIQLVLRPHWPGIQNLYNDWANFAYYTTCLFAGLMLTRHPELEQAVRAERERALGLGLASAVVLLGVVVGVIGSEAVALGGSAVAGWAFIVALLGFARERCERGLRVSDELRESAFPVYVLHQFFIVVIGYRVVALSLPVAAKFTIILLASVVATLLVYRFAIRPFAPARVLVGLSGSRRGRRRYEVMPTTTVLVLAAMVAVAAPASAAVPGPVGLWYAEGGAAQVEITRCGEALCGRVVWLRSPLDEYGCELRDQNNRDAALRGRSIVGLELLSGVVQSPHRSDLWLGGRIYDPASGSTYRCTLELVDVDRLKVRGYIGVPLLGRTTTWIRVGARVHACGLRE